MHVYETDKKDANFYKPFDDEARFVLEVYTSDLCVHMKYQPCR